MPTRYISEEVKKRLYAESMGRCMNPACQRDLFSHGGDLIEKAHIDPYCATADNSFENLVLLCPNCHTDFDKNHAFTAEEVLGWKRIRQEEVERMFSKKFSSFEDLKREVAPLLEENKSIFENYYLTGQNALWDKFEVTVLQNNRKLKHLLSANLGLIQSHNADAYSNRAVVRAFITHVDEFENTRSDDEKVREVLFPREINSMFGVAPVEDSILPSTESLEMLISKLIRKDCFKQICIGTQHPYFEYEENEKIERVLLKDTPRLRQLYNDYHCFRGVGVRLESLNYALNFIRSRRVSFEFPNMPNLREIMLGDQKMIFVYEYCLSEAFLRDLTPEQGSVIVNLHNWNKESCISKQAYTLAEAMDVRLLTMNEFYRYINGL